MSSFCGNSLPVSSKTQMVDVPSIVLPAVTVCNMNLMRKSHLSKDKFIESIFLALNGVNSSSVDFEDTELLAQVDAYDARKLFREAGHALHDLLPGCAWQANETSCSEFFAPIMTPLNTCYTFHSAKFLLKRPPLTALAVRACCAMARGCLG